MKEIDVNRNIQPRVPTVFVNSFPVGFGVPQETEIDQIAGQINQEFINRKLRRKEYMDEYFNI